MLAHHAKFWWRLRAGLVIVAALVILAGLGSLAQSAIDGQVQESIRKALWVLGALLVSVVLHRLMSLADLVAQLRERIARQNHRIHLLEATLRRHGSPVPGGVPLEWTSATLDGNPTIMLTATATAPLGEDALLYRADAEPNDAGDAEPRSEISRPAVDSQAHAQASAADAEELGSLCRDFRAAVAERNLIEALRVGRLLRHRFPHSRRAMEFEAIEPVLQARLRAEPAPASRSPQRV